MNRRLTNRWQLVLRHRLQQITDNPDRSEHRKLLDELRADCPHTVQVLAEPTDDLGYNCVMYAFGIERDTDYIELVLTCPSEVHGDTNFVQFLIEKGDLIEVEGPQPGVLVIYFQEETVRHIGRVVSNARVSSKWGIGELYEHDILDVPDTYGDEVRYFQNLGRDTVLRRFIEFAEGKGVSFGASDG